MKSTIRAALESRLSTLTPSWPTCWEAVDFTVPQDTGWQRATLLMGETTALGAGPNAPSQWQGVFHIVAWTPARTGPAAAQARASAIMNHFSRGLALGNVIILQASFGPALVEPKLYGLPVKIPFVFHS